MDLPLLLIDIDGVLSVFGFDPRQPPEGRFESVDGIVHFLSAAAARHLIELANRFELVWCSGWEEKADEHLPFALGLPAGLPHLNFARSGQEADRHWKLDAIDGYAGPGRPLAWIDDAHDETCRAWAAERAAPTLLVATDPATRSHGRAGPGADGVGREPVQLAELSVPAGPAPKPRQA